MCLHVMELKTDYETAAVEKNSFNFAKCHIYIFSSIALDFLYSWLH